ncbi:hypothetical protein SUGI_0861580 [Cryptomeria japonica]|nr:hypothetical protein SUGI_0861580 [Cryptomeria japonica]
MEYLPDSTGRLGLLEKLIRVKSFPVAVCQLTNLKELRIKECPVSALDLGAGLQRQKGELEVLRAETSWEKPGIESLESPERLRKVVLRANRRAGVDGCIQSIQKCPVGTMVCMWAVQNAASLVYPSDFSTISFVDFCSNIRIDKKHRAEEVHWQPTNGNATIVCFVVDCVASDIRFEIGVGKGKWVWTSQNILNGHQTVSRYA